MTTVYSPAKINLFLAVNGKRSDGYHEIETLFYPLPGLSDKIEFREHDSGEFEVACDTPGVPCTHENLCWKATLAYCSVAGLPLPSLKITLFKNIPVAAGMGGGSSDAATVLLELQKRYSALSRASLHAIAMKLGADVPFFLNPSPAIASGIGEKITYLENMPSTLPILIVSPGFPVSAAWTYRHINKEKTTDAKQQIENAVSALKNADWHTLATTMRNDLEHSLFNKFPIMSIIREKMLESGALRVMVTGSGPTLFALYSSEANKKNAQLFLSKLLAPQSLVFAP